MNTEERSDGLRFLTYLSPGIPQVIFNVLVEHVGRTLACEQAGLAVETRVSGPERDSVDPFTRREADVGFMCLPSFAWLRDRRRPPVELLGVAPVFQDERNGGRPVYFCDVVARRDGPVRSFDDLQGRSWAYNDECSLSGYYSLLGKLAEIGAGERFIDRVIRSGSHSRSLELVLRGGADAAAIDSNVLRMGFRESPGLREELRVIESWGPFPIQPVVVRSTLDPHTRAKLRASFLSAHEDECCRRVFSKFGLQRFISVGEDDYPVRTLALGEPGGRQTLPSLHPVGAKGPEGAGRPWGDRQR